MKKVLLLTITLFAIILFASAQINKGSVLLGGGISLGKGKSTYETAGVPNNSNGSQYGVSIFPSVGLAIKPNTIVGINFNYGHSQNKDDNTSNKQEYNNFSAGAFLRRYLPLGKNFYLFGETGLGFSQSKNTYLGTYNQTNKNTGISLSLYPGVSYAVSKGFQLEVAINNLVSLSYNNQDQSNLTSNGTVTNSTNNKSISFTTNASTSAPLLVGFRFFISK